MPDAQIVNSAVADGESAYTLKGGVAFVLKAVYGEFDGSASASAFLPAVLIASDDGQTVALAADQSVQVAAGGSAAVSFFPGGVSGGAGAEPAIYGVADIPAGTNIVVPSGVTTAVEFTAWDSNDFDVWKNDLPNHNPGIGSSTTMYAAKAGFYIVHAAGAWEAGAYNRAIRLESFNGQNWLTFHPLLGTNTRYDADATLKVNQIPPHVGTEALDGRAWGMIVNPSDSPPLGFEVLLNQDSGSDKNFGFQIFAGVRVGAV